MSSLRSKKIISVVIAMLCTLAFAITMAGVTTDRMVDAAGSHYYQLRIGYIDYAGDRNHIYFDIETSEKGKAALSISDLNKYAKGEIGKGDKVGPEDKDFTINKVRGDSQKFKDTFNNRWTITGAYCFDGDETAKKGDFYNDMIWFDAWREEIFGKSWVSLQFKDEFGIDWNAGKGNNGALLTLGNFDNSGIPSNTEGEISTADQLTRLAHNVNKLTSFGSGMNYENCVLKLTADIDLQGIDWTPIGYHRNPNESIQYQYAFRGTFDGQGHTISNLSIIHRYEDVFWKYNDNNTKYDDRHEGIGLFGTIFGATIKNLVMTDATIDVGGTNNYANTDFAYVTDAVGILVAEVDASNPNKPTTIENCQILRSTIIAQDQGRRGSQYAGGLVGLVTTEGGILNIKNCSVQADITVRCCSGAQNTDVGVGAGGILGYGFSNYTPGIISTRINITNCYYTGVIEALDQKKYEDGNHVEWVSVGGIASGMFLALDSYEAVYRVLNWNTFTDEKIKEMLTITNCFAYLQNGTEVTSANWQIDNNRDEKRNLRDPDYNPNDKDTYLRGAPLDAIVGPTYWDPEWFYNNTIVQGANVVNSVGYIGDEVLPGRMRLYTTNKTNENDRKVINTDPNTSDNILMTETTKYADADTESMFYAQRVVSETQSNYTMVPGEFYTNMNWDISCDTEDDSLWYLPRVGDMHYDPDNQESTSTYYGMPILRGLMNFKQYRTRNSTGVLHLYPHKDMIVLEPISDDRYRVCELGEDRQNDPNNIYKIGDAVLNIIELRENLPIFIKEVKSGEVVISDAWGNKDIMARSEGEYNGSALFLDGDKYSDTMMLPSPSSSFGELSINKEDYTYYGYKLSSRPNMSAGYMENGRNWEIEGYEFVASFSFKPPELWFGIEDTTKVDCETIGGLEWEYAIQSGYVSLDSSIDTSVGEYLEYGSPTEYIKYDSVPMKDGDDENKLVFNNNVVTFIDAEYDDSTKQFGKPHNISIECSILADSIYEFVGWAVYVLDYEGEKPYLDPEAQPEHVFYDQGSVDIHDNFVIKAMIRLKTATVALQGNIVDVLVENTNKDYGVNGDVISDWYIGSYKMTSPKEYSVSGMLLQLPVETEVVAREDGFDIHLPFGITINGYESNIWHISYTLKFGYERMGNYSRVGNKSKWSEMNSPITLTGAYTQDNACKFLLGINAIEYRLEFGWEAGSRSGSFEYTYTVADSVKFYNKGLTAVKVNLTDKNGEMVEDVNFLTYMEAAKSGITNWALSTSRTFGGWYLRIDSYNRVLNYDRKSSGYTLAENGEGYAVVTSADGTTNIKFVLLSGTPTFVDLDGYTCFNISSIQNTDSITQGSFGNLLDVLMLKWANKYDVYINAGEGAVDWNSYSNIASDMIGARALDNTNSGFVEQIGDNQIRLEVSNSDQTPVFPFYRNEEQAFKTAGKSNATSLSSRFGDLYSYVINNGKAKDHAVYYCVYNYGHEIIGWTITFEYNGNTRYLSLNLNDPMEPVWQQGINETENLFATWEANKINMDTFSIGTYADELDNWFTSIGKGSDCIIRMTPIWQAVSIDVSIVNENGTQQLTKTNNTYMRYGGKFIAQRSHVNASFVPANYTPTYLAVDDQAIAFAENGTGYDYLYTNISHDAYKYASGVYTLLTQLYCTANIRRVTISGVNGAEIEDYKSYIASSDAHTKQTLTVFDQFKSAKLDTYSSYTARSNDTKCNQYSEYLNNFVKEYVNYINNPSKTDTKFGVLRKLFSESTSYMIYLAEGCKVGNLPEFKKESYTHVATATAGNASKLYAYKTSKYDNDKHSSVMTHTKGEYNGQDYGLDNIWSYSYHNSNPNTENLGMNLVWYRKSYYFNVETKENNKLGQYGYVLMKVEDKQDSNPTFYYLIEYDTTSSKMSAYRFNAKPAGNISGLSLKTTTNLLVQAGCDVTFEIYDQGKDHSRSSYIGYRYKDFSMKYSNKTKQSSEMSIKYSESVFENEFNVVDNAIVNVVVNFEKIEYDLTVQLNDNNSGSFSVTSTNGTNISNMTSYNVSKLVVGDVLTIKYTAKMGYEFQTNAFVFYTDNNSSKSLVLAENSSTLMKNREYKLTITSEWIRDNFYAKTAQTCKSNNAQMSSYPTCDVNTSNVSTYGKIGALQINTQQIKFSVKAMMNDTYNNKEVDAGQNVLASQWYLSNGTVDISTLFNDLGIGSYGYISKANTKYAIIQSYAYISGKNITNKASIAYVYPLKSSDIPDDIYAVSIAGHIGEMLGVANGEIVPTNNRTLYIAVEIREIKSLKVTIEKQTYDTEIFSPYITVTASGSNSLNGYSYQIKRQHSSAKAEQTIYGYQGMTQIFTGPTDAEFNIHYSATTFVYDGSTLSSGSAQLKKNSTLEVKFTPKQLTPNFTFEVDGKTYSGAYNTVKSHISDQLTSFTVTDGGTYTSKYYINQTLNFGFTTSYQYNIGISVNSDSVICSGGKASYTIYAGTYTDGGLNIRVKLDAVPSAKVKLEYIVDGGSSGDLGTMSGTRKYNNTVQATYDYNDLKSGISMISGESIIVSLNPSYGYSVYSYIHSNSEVVYNPSKPTGVTAKLYNDNGVVKFEIANFAASGILAGTYQIKLTKTSYSITLNNSGYTISNGSKTSTATGNTATLANVQVGQTITFSPKAETSKQVEVERYYYKIGNVEYDVTPSSSGKGTFAITSSFLKDYFSKNTGSTIAFYVESNPKYTVTIINNAPSNVRHDTSAPLVYDDNSPVYFKSGYTMELTLTNSMPGKYEIRVEGLTSTYTFTEETKKITFVIKSNLEINIYASKVQFDNKVVEYVQTAVNGKPTYVVRTTNTSKVTYAETSSGVAIDDKRLDGMYIEIKGNDLPIIKFSMANIRRVGVVFTSVTIGNTTKDGSGSVSHNSKDYYITFDGKSISIIGNVNGDNVTTTFTIDGTSLKYTVYDDIEVGLYYATSISVGGGG